MYKRKRKLIDKALQLKLVAVFTAIGATCALFQVVLINFGLLEIAKSIPAGGTELLDESRWMMLTNIMWTLGVLIPLMTCIGIVVTHRIAGPAYRMRTHLTAIAEGGPVRPCKIRKDDELQDLCGALNAALARIAPAQDQGEDYVEEWQLEATPSPIHPKKTADTPAKSTSDEAA
jgi:hypothetical protein